MTGQFDIIFSTFVWEHIAEPQATLDYLLERLAPGGSLFLFSPRYDVPGYVPPALRHLPRFYSLWLSLWLQVTRLSTLLGGRAKFWIVTDPALFHVTPWFRDADAVHLVSRHDLTLYLKDKNVTIKDCWPALSGVKARLLERFLKLCVEIKKSE